MSYKKKLCVYMSFNIKQHIYTSVISWCLTSGLLCFSSSQHCGQLFFPTTHRSRETDEFPRQHTATHCNTLQHTATPCNTLQHTATHYNTLQHTAQHCNTSHHTATHCSRETGEFPSLCGSNDCVVSHIRMGHVTHPNESRCTSEWVMSHIRMSHVTHPNESCHASEWFMSRIRMSHVTHPNESRHASKSVTFHRRMRSRPQISRVSA